MKKIILFCVTTILIMGGGVLYIFTFSHTQPTTPVAQQLITRELSPEVERVITEHTSLFTELVNDVRVLSAIKEVNVKNAKLSKDEVVEIDLNWRASGLDETLIKEILANESTLMLRSFQQKYPEFKEIFITDQYGLIIAMTNKTSDYLQSDEDWWIDTYRNGVGETHHGIIEFDESAQSKAISVYVPVVDEAGKVIGIIKAVLDLSYIKKLI